MTRRQPTGRIFHRRIIAGVFGQTFLQSPASAAGPLLIAYGGHNETMVPIWVGIEKGLFRKYGVDLHGAANPQRPDHDGDPRTRAARRCVWAAPSSAAQHDRERAETRLFCRRQQPACRAKIIVRKGIESIEDLRGKSFRRAKHRRRLLDLDHGRARRPGSSTRTNINSTCASSATPAQVTQALITGNVDAMVVPYSYGEIAKRAGANARWPMPAS